MSSQTLQQLVSTEFAADVRAGLTKTRAARASEQVFV